MHRADGGARLGADGVGQGLGAAVRGQAAVSRQVRAGDERRVVGQQERDRRAVHAQESDQPGQWVATEHVARLP